MRTQILSVLSLHNTHIFHHDLTQREDLMKVIMGDFAIISSVQALFEAPRGWHAKSSPKVYIVNQ